MKSEIIIALLVFSLTSVVKAGSFSGSFYQDIKSSVKPSETVIIKETCLLRECIVVRVNEKVVEFVLYQVSRDYRTRRVVARGSIESEGWSQKITNLLSDKLFIPLSKSYSSVASNGVDGSTLTLIQEGRSIDVWSPVYLQCLKCAGEVEFEDDLSQYVALMLEMSKLFPQFAHDFVELENAPPISWGLTLKDFRSLKVKK